MARLPSNQFLVQMLDHQVIVFEDGTEIEVVRYDNNDPSAAARAQKTIHDSEVLSDEDKCFAHFWCGYFHAHGHHL